MSDPIRSAISHIRSVYAELENLREVRNCTARTTCCRFGLTGRTPMLTAGEALVAAAGVRASGRKSLPETDHPDGRCPLLCEDGGCTIYDSRPFGCRTHFCQAAGGQIPRSLVKQQIRALEEIAESLGDTDVRPIAAAISDALEKLPKRSRRKHRSKPN